MIGPPPERGSVLRYSYLWADESAAGREEGRKDRPVVVLALAIWHGEDSAELLVVAVTHVPPLSPTDAVPFPQSIKRRLGLDEDPAWIVTTEANAFVWPGPDVRPVPGRRPPTVIYGRVPDDLLQRIARSFLTNRKTQRARLVAREG